ncbi:MAG: hypothetical protein V3T14_06095, partial [Myxococcota bacterium]
MSARWVCLLGLLLATDAHGLSMTGVERFVLGCFSPPTITFHPGDSGVAWVACSSFPQGVFPIRVLPGVPLGLDPTLPVFLLPADLTGDVCASPSVPFIDDVWVERADLAWITTTNCESVIPFNPTTGARRPVLYQGLPRAAIPTSLEIAGSFVRTDGVAVTSFRSNFTSGVVRVGGRLLVSTSNFARPGSSPVLYPGTLLLFDIEESQDGTIRVEPADPPYVVTTDPNPTAVTLLSDGSVAVTNTGLLELLSPPAAAGPGS